MNVTYHVEFDVDDDGRYSGDLTPDTIDIKWRSGMRRPFESVAAVSVANITLRNPDGRYSPDAPASALEIGLALRIRTTELTGGRQHFDGMIVSVEPVPGEHGEQLAVITAECVMRTLMEARVEVEAQVNTTAAIVINTILDRVPTRARFLDGAFVIGLAGRAELDQTARLPTQDATHTRNIQPGLSTFAYVGDRWDEGVEALRAITEVVEAERGRFYINRGAGFAMLNRQTQYQKVTSQSTFSDDMDGLSLVYGADRVSRVRVTLRPRRIGADNEVLWRLGQAQLIRAGTEKRFSVRFRGENDERVGALNVLPPRPFTDYTANTLISGSGADVTAQVEFGLLGFNGSSAQVRLANPGTTDAYLLPGAVLRGRALYLSPALTVEERDPESETFYGVRELNLNLLALTDIAAAEDIARFELFRRAQPRSTVREMTLSSRMHLNDILVRALFDRISITETQTAHSNDYFIAGEQHHVFNAGNSHTVTWTLEPVNPAGFWQMNFGMLGESTRLLY
ncbi:MAG: hypothetical protein AAFR56_02570 [Chloroflexota bacterium]